MTTKSQHCVRSVFTKLYQLTTDVGAEPEESGRRWLEEEIEAADGVQAGKRRSIERAAPALLWVAR